MKFKISLAVAIILAVNNTQIFASCLEDFNKDHNRYMRRSDRLYSVGDNFKAMGEIGVVGGVIMALGAPDVAGYVVGAGVVSYITGREMTRKADSDRNIRSFHLGQHTLLAAYSNDFTAYYFKEVMKSAQEAVKNSAQPERVSDVTAELLRDLLIDLDKSEKLCSKHQKLFDTELFKIVVNKSLLDKLGIVNQP